MENIETPKWVKDQLLEEERVLSKTSTRSAYYYATDKRLLRFRGKSDYDALEYDKVSITFKKYGRGLGIFRAIAVLFGLLVIGFGIVGFIGPEYHSDGTVTSFAMPNLGTCLIFWVMGLFFIVMMLYFGYAYYQIESPGFNKEDLKKWRFDRPRWGAGNIDRFAETVKERSGG